MLSKHIWSNRIVNIKAIWQIKTLNYIFIIILKNPGLLFDISSEFDYDKSENPGSTPQNFIFPHPLTFHVIFLPSEEFRAYIHLIAQGI